MVPQNKNNLSSEELCKQTAMSANSLPNIIPTPQCQFFVVRKKRLCRMTVRPGRQYCGEHEPEPRTDEGKDDTRIPCPYDPKHTCYASKLEKHLSICNARQAELPPYIEHNVNAPADIETCVRKPLSEIPRETLMQVIKKVNLLYEKYIAGNISEAPQLAIHTAVQREFSEADRGESSRRHMRQASSLLHIAEQAGLVTDRSCYVELGAGKGQLSFYIGNAWCGANTGSNVVVVDRAALRHKRDNKLRDRVSRVRADLAHLALGRLPEVARSDGVVGFAKHLCGVATDYALRCVTSESVVRRSRGAVLATCCHHRCERAAYVARAHLQELGISGADLNVMLGIVSWATCGDGRSRDRRKLDEDQQQSSTDGSSPRGTHGGTTDTDKETSVADEGSHKHSDQPEQDSYWTGAGGHACRAEAGRRAKAVLDWGRVLYLRGMGFEARLCYYVPSSVSLENVCLVATKPGVSR